MQKKGSPAGLKKETEAPSGFHPMEFSFYLRPFNLVSRQTTLDPLKQPPCHIGSVVFLGAVRHLHYGT